MRCSCGNRECSCENRCECHPHCLCLPCAELRGNRCQICGLLRSTETFSCKKDDTVGFCKCVFSRCEVSIQDENKNPSSETISESAEELRNIFRESYDDSENETNRFLPIGSSELSTVDSLSELSEQGSNNTETSESSNYLNIGETQNMREDDLTENSPLGTVEENTRDISKVIETSTSFQASNIARERKLETSPRKRCRSRDFNYDTEGMKEEMEALNFAVPPKKASIECVNDSISVSNSSSLPSSDVPIDVTEQSNTQTETSCSERCDSEASFSASSCSKVHSSPVPTSVSSTIPLKSLGKSKMAGTKAESAQHATEASETEDSIEVPVRYFNCFEYYPYGSLDRNSTDPFYRRLGIIPAIRENPIPQDQSRSTTIHESHSQQPTNQSNTPEDPNTTPSTVERPFYHNRLNPNLLAEAFGVTTHNQHLFPFPRVCYVPFPLRTQFPPFPDFDRLRRLTSVAEYMLEQDPQRPSEPIAGQMHSIASPNVSSEFQIPNHPVSVARIPGENVDRLSPLPSRVIGWVNALPENFNLLSPMSSSTEEAKGRSSGTSDETQNKSEDSDIHKSEDGTVAENKSEDSDIHKREDGTAAENKSEDSDIHKSEDGTVAEEFPQSSDTEIYRMRENEDSED